MNSPFKQRPDPGISVVEARKLSGSREDTTRSSDSTKEDCRSEADRIQIHNTYGQLQMYRGVFDPDPGVQIDQPIEL